MPTETVYGLAADATNAEAVARIYEAKGRPSFNPLIVHVPDSPPPSGSASSTTPRSRLPNEHWPGPLTLVVPLRAGRAASRRSSPPACRRSALRVPAHPAMQALLRAAGRPLAAPSANASGSISPTRAEHVLKSLGGRIPLIIDGGADRARARIDDRRGDRRAAAAAAAGPDRRRCRAATRRARSKRRASSPAIMRRRSRCGSNAVERGCRRISDRLRRDRRRCQPQPVRRPGRSRGAAVRPAPPGRCVGQAAHRGRAGSRRGPRRRDQRPLRRAGSAKKGGQPPLP